MTALTASFNELLKQKEAPLAKTSFSVEELDEFLKEAYRIVGRSQITPCWVMCLHYTSRGIEATTDETLAV